MGRPYGEGLTLEQWPAALVSATGGGVGGREGGGAGGKPGVGRGTVVGARLGGWCVRRGGGGGPPPPPPPPLRTRLNRSARPFPTHTPPRPPSPPPPRPPSPPHPPQESLAELERVFRYCSGLRERRPLHQRHYYATALGITGEGGWGGGGGDEKGEGGPW